MKKKQFHALSCIIILLLQACGTTNNEQKESVPTLHCLDDYQKVEIKLDTVRSESFQGTLKLSGKVTFNEDKLIRIFPMASGRVKKVNVTQGDYVKAGEVLAELISSEVADLQSQLIVAESSRQIAEKELQIQKDFFESGIATSKDVINAEKELHIASAEIRKIKEILFLTGNSGQFATYHIKAPNNGYIVEKHISPGMEIRPDHEELIFAISDLEDLWVVANVYEKDLSKVDLGNIVSIVPLAYPETTISAKINKISDILDPVSKVAKIRMSIENKNKKLKPEMFTTVSLEYNQNKIFSIVPDNYLVFDRNKHFVVLANDPCNLTFKEVMVIGSQKGFSFISGDIKDGDIVIGGSQLLIYDNLLKR